MSLRKIVVISTTKSKPKEFQSEATKWGQLLDVLSPDYGDLSKMRVVVKESKVTLESPEAELPLTDFKLYMSPKEIKAGAHDLQAVLESLKAKFTKAFEDIIAEVEDGDFDTEDEDEDAEEEDDSLSSEDQDFLKEMKRW